MSLRAQVNKLLTNSQYTIINKNIEPKYIDFSQREKNEEYKSRYFSSQKHQNRPQGGLGNRRGFANTSQKQSMLAGAISRFVAFFIDSNVASLTKAILLDFMGINLQEGFVKDNIWLIIFLIYMGLATYFTNGQSLGKICLGIRVVHTDDKLSLMTVLIREVVCKFVMIKIPILFLSVVLSRRRNSFADYFADTRVVKQVHGDVLSESISFQN